MWFHGRASAHGVMDPGINPSWWTHWQTLNILLEQPNMHSRKNKGAKCASDSGTFQTFVEITGEFYQASSNLG